MKQREPSARSHSDKHAVFVVVVVAVVGFALIVVIVAAVTVEKTLQLLQSGPRIGIGLEIGVGVGVAQLQPVRRAPRQCF